ncbi:MAG: ribonuclease H-like domain-containing protein [Anaplasmataceae bacterium]|nr:ribonuclease H-like domain-containing protein [Anaplasmataceae bacterium]
MSKLIIDIETIGEDFDSLDKTTQETLTRWIGREARDAGEYETALKDIKEGLGFSPLTGEIVVIGVYDQEKKKGVVYFQDPSGKLKEFEEEEFTYKPLPEKEMLQSFWNGTLQYNEFVTFNGRSFDIPFMLVRSAIHKVKPTKDLMSNRYAGSQKFGALHIDLLDQLTFYGAVRRKGSLHLWTRAFGITSPKTGGITGDDVGRLFKEGKSKEIALYNARDLIATSLLYDYWHNYLRP